MKLGKDCFLTASGDDQSCAVENHTISTSSILLIDSRCNRVLYWATSSDASPVSTVFCKAA